MTIKSQKTGKLIGVFIGLALWVASSSSVKALSLDSVLAMDLVVHFIDVGVGDAILIELPNRDHEVVIDGGDRRKGYNFLDYIGPEIDGAVELAVITHPDYDHWSGIERLTEQHGVLELWDPGYDRKCKWTSKSGVVNKKKRDRDTYRKFAAAMEKEDNKPGNTFKYIKPITPDPATPKFEMDGLELYVLHADDNPQGGDCSYIVNNASVVLKLKFLDVSMLLTGDANGKERDERGSVEPGHVEGKLLALEKKHPLILKSDVLKVPHHGSETANTTKFIKSVAPKFAIISSSYTSHYQLPKQRVVRRYQTAHFEDGRKIEKVLRTNFNEKTFEKRRFGDDHIICGTNGVKGDLICDYIWRFEQ